MTYRLTVDHAAAILGLDNASTYLLTAQQPFSSEALLDDEIKRAVGCGLPGDDRGH